MREASCSGELRGVMANVTSVSRSTGDQAGNERGYLLNQRDTGRTEGCDASAVAGIHIQRVALVAQCVRYKLRTSLRCRRISLITQVCLRHIDGASYLRRRSALEDVAIDGAIAVAKDDIDRCQPALHERKSLCRQAGTRVRRYQGGVSICALHAESIVGRARAIQDDRRTACDQIAA